MSTPSTMLFRSSPSSPIPAQPYSSSRYLARGAMGVEARGAGSSAHFHNALGFCTPTRTSLLVSLSRQVVISDFQEICSLPAIPIPSLKELEINLCQLDDDDFASISASTQLPHSFLPAGLKKLRLIHSRLGDSWAAHLAGMSRLSEIEVARFDLDSPLVLPDGCAWRKVHIWEIFR